MITLGIDTSNYATSVALVDNDNHQVVFAEKRFLPVEEGKIGLRQQQALFEHIKNLTNIFSSFKGVDIGAVGVSVRPKDEENSYMPCFLAGKMSAYSLAGGLGVPVIETSHQTGHLTSALYYLNKEDLFDVIIKIFSSIDAKDTFDELFGKEVLDAEVQIVGKVSDVVFDKETFEITDLVIKKTGFSKKYDSICGIYFGF